MLRPEKTCKTIRELSNEDLMSSMGNLSAQISPQITSVKNVSIKSKHTSQKVLRSEKRLRRRQSECYVQTQEGSNTLLQNNQLLPIKSSNTNIRFMRQRSIQIGKSPGNEENSLKETSSVGKDMSFTKSEIVMS